MCLIVFCLLLKAFYVYGCTNQSKKNPELISFPKDPALKKQWKIRIQGQNLVPLVTRMNVKAIRLG